MNKLAILCLLVNIINCKMPKNVEISNQNKLFEIDWVNNQFLKDGEPFRYISGSIHYFRHPRPYWKDRLKKLRAAGFNAVSVYIEWSYHEPSQGIYNFTEDRDFIHFINLAQEEGLLVILRPGPYICAERDFGGYPSWLLTESPEMELRTNDTRHTKYIYQWLSKLLPLIQPLLYGNGGPIIMVQVENEYGSYSAHDTNYTIWLRDVFTNYIGKKSVLFTTDGAASYFLQYGPIPWVFTTVDFASGVNVSATFTPLRTYQTHGPLVNSEYYTGWLTHWGEPFQTAQTDEVVKTLKDILDLNASVNLFMFAGGTNFGFTSGANYGTPSYQPQITSYDYGSPLDEAGDPTEKYYAIKKLISEYTTLPDVPIPRPQLKGDYGMVEMVPIVSLFDAPSQYLPVRARYPLTFEALQQSYGFILYETKVPDKIGDPAILKVEKLHDRAIVYLERQVVGVLSRAKDINTMSMLARPGQTLRLLVENQGRINYGNFKDFKGILSNVTIDNFIIQDWIHIGYPLSNISVIENLKTTEVSEIKPPAFYSARFKLPENMDVPLDTFVNMDGWGKGVLFVNQHNLGRYWPTTGPQITLYLPGCYLYPFPAENQITIFEMEFESPNRTITFITKPILNVTYIPYRSKKSNFFKVLNKLGAHS
uniref:Beta-galactosidase n=1 Tax=Clastoptera arizonana TaxID=38151 RepID=A0A1B6C0R4_9HEMI